jgi:hypothetical protein
MDKNGFLVAREDDIGGSRELLATRLEVDSCFSQQAANYFLGLCVRAPHKAHYAGAFLLGEPVRHSYGQQLARIEPAPLWAEELLEGAFQGRAGRWSDPKAGGLPESLAE